MLVIRILPPYYAIVLKYKYVWEGYDRQTNFLQEKNTFVGIDCSFINGWWMTNLYLQKDQPVYKLQWFLLDCNVNICVITIYS